MRPGVIEVEAHTVMEGPAQGQGHAMVGRLTGIHPRRHRTALDVKKRVAAGNGYALARKVRVRLVTIQSVQAIQVTSIVVAVDALIVIRRSTARKTDVLQCRKHVLNKW